MLSPNPQIFFSKNVSFSSYIANNLNLLKFQSLITPDIIVRFQKILQVRLVAQGQHFVKILKSGYIATAI